jgi:hypothetical protein
MAKSDLQARPIYHRTRDSTEAHLTVVFAALAVSRWIESHTSRPIRKFVRTSRRYSTIQIQAGRTSSPPPTHSPSTSARRSKRSTTPAGMCTKLSLFPYVAGQGTWLFDGVPKSYQLDLVSSTATGSGIVELAYRRHR